MTNTNKIDLKIGYLCNNNCIHCAIHDARQELIDKKLSTDLTTDQIKSSIDQYCSQYDMITLTGGEITIRKDFLEILRYAAVKFKLVEVQTNGRFLARAKNLDVLSTLTNVYYSIAIHGCDSATHDKITQKQHSFDQTVASIRQMTQLPNKPKVVAKFVLTNYNKHCVCQTVEMCAQLGCSQIDIAYVHGCTEDQQLLHDMLPTYDEIRQTINDACNIGKQLGIDVTLETFPLCVIDPEHFTSIDEIVMSTINAFVQPVNEGVYDWSVSRVQFNKLKQNQCLSCALRNNCEGPWSEYWDVHKGCGLNPVLAGKPVFPILEENRAIKLAGYVNLFGKYY